MFHTFTGLLRIYKLKVMAIFDKNKKQYSGVFSTGAMGAIAPLILRKRLIAPETLHLPRMYVFAALTNFSTLIFLFPDFFSRSEQFW